MKPSTRWPVLLLAMIVSLPMVVRADDDDDDEEEHHHGRRGRVSAVDPTYSAECGSCHLAFPPRLLPARSWTTLLAGLDDHFGQNAEVDAKTRAQLERFLTQNAGRDVPGAPLRITETRWWRHEHDEIPQATFQRKAIISAANCGACHAGASRGDFDEHSVRIPRDAPAAR